MKNEAEQKVVDLLRGGRALSVEHRRRILSNLTPTERGALRRIASGNLQVDDPRSRPKAIAMLGELAEKTSESRTVLHRLLGTAPPRLQIKAIQALAKQGTDDMLPLKEIVRNPDANPGMALAAARVIAAHDGRESIEDLTALRTRFLFLVPNERSPSIVALDHLIKQARGELSASSSEQQPKPLV